MKSFKEEFEIKLKEARLDNLTEGNLNKDSNIQNHLSYEGKIANDSYKGYASYIKSIGDMRTACSAQLKMVNSC